MASFVNKKFRPCRNPFFDYIKDGNYHPAVFLYLGLMTQKEYRDFIQRLSLEDDMTNEGVEVYYSERVLAAVTYELQEFNELSLIRPEIDFDIMHAMVLPLTLKKMEKHAYQTGSFYYPIEFMRKVEQMNSTNRYGTRNANARNFFFVAGEIVCQTLKHMYNIQKSSEDFQVKADLMKKRSILKKEFVDNMKGIPEYFFSLIQPVLTDIYKSEDHPARRKAYHQILVNGFEEFDDSPVISDEEMEHRAVQMMDTARRAVVYYPGWPLEGCLSGKKELFNGLSELKEQADPQNLWEGSDCWKGYLYFKRKETHVRG